MGKLKRLIYRMQIRKALQQASIEELTVTKEELHNEFQRRNTKNGKSRI